MQVDFSKTQYISNAAGFRRSGGFSVSASVSAVSLTAGQAVFFSLNTPIENADAISVCQVRLEGLESFWRQVEGYVFTQFPSVAAPDYEIGLVSSFTGSTHKLFVYIADQGGGGASVPAWTLRLRLSVYDAPFS